MIQAAHAKVDNVAKSNSDSGKRRRNCPFCGTDNRSEAVSPFNKQPWNLKQCAQCGFLYLEDAVSYQQLEEEYAWTTSSSVETDRRRHEDPVMFRISRTIRRLRSRFWPKRDKCVQWIQKYVGQGRVLDIGCGKGSILKKLDCQYRVFGIEIDCKAAAEANELARRNGGRVVQADALSGLGQFDDNEFDGVVMRSFLEHETQPQKVLNEAARTLKPRQPAIIKVPNYGSALRRVRGARWCGFRFPDHVNYFEPSTLKAMVERAGMRVYRFRWTDRSPLSDNMWMVAKKAA
jgi:methionine biosynthesis protein MetW